MKLHIPVLLNESMAWLGVRPGGVYADLTLGMGGHSSKILGLSAPDGFVIGIDRDPRALEIASGNLSEYDGRFRLFHAAYSDAAELIKEAGFEHIDGFLVDLGVSTMQLKLPERGFSFMADAPLDMRMDTTKGMTAADILAEMPEADLSEIIFRFGEERWAKRIAKHIAERRVLRPIESTADLADIVKGAIPKKFWPPKTHPATRTFQALRIAVNDELGQIEGALLPMVGMLKPGGRAVVISYHSLEDRIVKDTFKALSEGCTCPRDFPVCVCGRKPAVKVITKKPVLPAEEESYKNPSARSAKLRAAERL